VNRGAHTSTKCDTVQQLQDPRSNGSVGTKGTFSHAREWNGQQQAGFCSYRRLYGSLFRLFAWASIPVRMKAIACHAKGARLYAVAFTTPITTPIGVDIRERGWRWRAKIAGNFPHSCPERTRANRARRILKPYVSTLNINDALAPMSISASWSPASLWSVPRQGSTPVVPLPGLRLISQLQDGALTAELTA
jgi:hypothetical protein